MEKSHTPLAKTIHWTFSVLYAYGIFKQVEDLEELEDASLLKLEILFAVVFLQLPGAIEFMNLMLGIGNQREGQFILGNKVLMLLLGVSADADNLVALGLESLIIIPEIARLGRAARGVVPRVEVEDHFLALELAEADRVAVLIHGIEVGGRLSSF